MSQCTFSNDQQQNAAIALVYLKNTGFSQISLDFSHATMLFKTTMLQQYVKSSQEFCCKELADTWKCILSQCVHFSNHHFKSILSNDELAEFIHKNCQLVNTLLSVMKSLPLFLLKKLNNGKEVKIAKTDDSTTVRNLASLIDNDMLLHICKNYSSVICDYKCIFNDDNMQVFNALAKTDFSFILSAICRLNEHA